MANKGRPLMLSIGVVLEQGLSPSGGECLKSRNRSHICYSDSQTSSCKPRLNGPEGGVPDVEVTAERATHQAARHGAKTGRCDKGHQTGA